VSNYDKLAKLWEKPVVLHFKVIPHYFSGVTKKYHGNLSESVKCEILEMNQEFPKGEAGVFTT
jgi:hypothetical protein